MGPDVVKGDLTAESVQHFFDVEGTLIVPAKRKDIGGQCTKKDGDCRGKEIRDSRYNDMVRKFKLFCFVQSTRNEFDFFTHTPWLNHNIESKRLSARQRLSHGSAKAA